MIAYRYTQPPRIPPAPVKPPQGRYLWPSWYSPPARVIPFDLAALKASVADDLGVDLEKLEQPTRHRPYVMARMIIARILRDRGWSFGMIAQKIGRDRKTLIANDNNVEPYARSYPAFRMALEKNRRLFLCRLTP